MDNYYKTLAKRAYGEGLGFDEAIENIETSYGTKEDVLSHFVLDTSDLFMAYESGRWPTCESSIPFEHMVHFLFSEDVYSQIYETLDASMFYENPPQTQLEFDEIDKIATKCVEEADDMLAIYGPVFAQQLPKAWSTEHASFIIPYTHTFVNNGTCLVAYDQSQIQSTDTRHVLDAVPGNRGNLPKRNP